MRAFVAAVILTGLGGCSPGENSSESVVTLSSSPDLSGMWRWETDVVQCNNISQAGCKYRGTMLLTKNDTPDQYDIKMTLQGIFNIGSLVERQDGAEQDCVGSFRNRSLSIQCTSDREKYPTWYPADFSFVQGESLEIWQG